MTFRRRRIGLLAMPILFSLRAAAGSFVVPTGHHKSSNGVATVHDDEKHGQRLYKRRLVTPAKTPAWRTRPATTAGQPLSSTTPPHSPLEDKPWDNDPSYFDRLREAAKDPATFEQFVLASKNCSPATADEAERTTKRKTGGGYQRAEEWDAEQKEKKDGSGMTWEQRVQFEGLKHGNQVKQNDIMNRHLNGF